MVGGIIPSLIVSTVKIASTTPAAPNKWPIIDLLELIGTLLLASVKQIKNRGVFLIINGFLWGFALLFFSGCGSYATAMPWIFAVGFISAIFMALNNTLLQIKSSDEMRGRMVSLSMMTFGIMPLSAVPFGALAEFIGTPGSLMIAGILLCFFMLFFYVFTPDFRRLSR